MPDVRPERSLSEVLIIRPNLSLKRKPAKVFLKNNEGRRTDYLHRYNCVGLCIFFDLNTNIDMIDCA